MESANGEMAPLVLQYMRKSNKWLLMNILDIPHKGEN